MSETCEHPAGATIPHWAGWKCLDCGVESLSSTADEIESLRAEVTELGVRLDEANGARGIAEEEAKRLRAEVERLRADLDATNAALREFGHHDGRCSITDLDSDGNHCACDCGLSVALGDQAPEQGGGK